MMLFQYSALRATAQKWEDTGFSLPIILKQTDLSWEAETEKAVLIAEEPPGITDFPTILLDYTSVE